MKKIQAWLPLMFAVVLIGGMITGYRLRDRLPASQGFFQTAQRNALQEAIDLIRMHYVDKVSIDSLTEDAVQAMLTHLDPHSVFIPARYLQEVNEDLQGNFQGIGVEFQIINDTVNVVNVMTGGPSAKAGVRVGDQIIKVGDSVVAGNGITSERIKRLLRGPGESKVAVTMMSEGKQKLINITRGTIPLYSVDAAYMIDSTTGFIHLNKFSSTSYEECMAAFEKLKQSGMKKLIFDLRDNGGGILGEAVDIVDEFLDKDKLIVYTEGARQPKFEYRCKRPGQFETGKLIVLVNEGSASASEVVAGALQDWDRATIIGRRTFGKGLVQEQYDLTGGAALRLTVARYYTPSGRSIQKSYASGREAYNDEVMKRFENGEMSSDTIQIQHGTLFHTKAGKNVYGGGGITPDIFVPYDTTGLSADLAPIFNNQLFAKFIYHYYVTEKKLFDQYKDPADFAAKFHPGDAAIRKLRDYAAANEVRVGDLSAHDRLELEKRIRSWMARQIWGMTGLYQLNNAYDLTVRKALVN